MSSFTEFEEPSARKPGVNPSAGLAVGAGAGLLVAVALLMFLVLHEPNPPPPPDVAADPLLSDGREVYLARCVSCHGTSGRGDGPIARTVSGTTVGDLTSPRWRHGDEPGQVLAVVRNGSANGAMPSWGKALSGHEVKAVTAYVYYLGKREVPAGLREP